MSKPTITHRTGPTPVGQRLRASTIPARRFDGPDASEWDDDLDDIMAEAMGGQAAHPVSDFDRYVAGDR